MPLRKDKGLVADRFDRRPEHKLEDGSELCHTLPFGRELWEYRTLIERKKYRKLQRILTALARFTKIKTKFPYPTKMEEFIKEINDSDSSYGRDESVLSEGFFIKQRIYTGPPGFKIYLCENSLFSKKPRDNKVVVKIINLKKTYGNYIYENLRNELDIILQVKHAFIIETLCVLFRKKQYYIFMRYAERGDLFNYLINFGSVTENRARLWFSQLANAVTFLHSLNIAHTDLCCENILITENFNLKITDFEFAVKINYEMGVAVPETHYHGSAEFATPEILRGKPFLAVGADTWALGVILYVMLTGSLPFTGPTSEDLLKSQRICKLRETNNCSTAITLLLVKVFRFKSSRRYNLQRIMQSDWFRKDQRLSAEGKVSPRSRPRKPACRLSVDPGRSRLVEDPAQEHVDEVEMIRFQPFLRQKRSRTNLIPIVYKEEDLGVTFSDDQSFGIPFRPGEEEAEHLRNLGKVWSLKKSFDNKCDDGDESLKGKKNFANLLHKAYTSAKHQADEL